MTDAPATMLDRLLNVFGMRDPDRTAYQFICPGVAVSGEDVAVDFRDGLWHLTQTDNVPNSVSASGDSKLTAILGLIAKRWGYEATFTPIKEGGDDD